MLQSFRQLQQQKLGFIASSLIILMMLVRVMMPVAHASTAMSGEASGLMMTICSASNIGRANVQRDSVFIPIEIAAKKQATKQANSHQSKCAVCYQVDQSTLENFNTLRAPAQLDLPTALSIDYQLSYIEKLADQYAIRAPPTLS